MSVQELAGPARRPVAWWGMAILVASEATLFGCLFGTYFYLRFHTRQWPPAGVPEPKVVLPLALAVMLALTSVPMAAASRWAAARRVGPARLAILAALAVECGYLVVQILQYRDDLRRFKPSEGAYGSIYYTLLGADHAHVLVAVLLNAWLLAKLARGLTPYRVRAVRAVALYCHAVNVLTLCAIGTVLSAATR
jgi:cytochrome c oxidase subunit III